MKITENEFLAYEGVRRYGKWNMFSPEAKEATGLNREKYLAIIDNYNKLADKYRDKMDWINNE
tara:strand:- start:705 stop:893 length:189 start_codon:yes stop_codon:yes gene_type:complete